MKNSIKLIFLTLILKKLKTMAIPGAGNENGFAIEKEKGGYLNLQLGKEGAPIYIDQSPSYIYKDPPTEYNQNGIRLPLTSPTITTSDKDSSDNGYNNERIVTSNFFTPMDNKYEEHNNERKLLVDQKNKNGRKLLQNRKLFQNQMNMNYRNLSQNENFPNYYQNPNFQNMRSFGNFSQNNFPNNKSGRNLGLNKELSHFETVANRRGPLNDRGISLQAPLKRSEVDKNFEVAGRGEYNHYLSDKDLFEQTKVMMDNVEKELTDITAMMGSKDIEVEKLIERLYDNKFH